MPSSFVITLALGAVALGAPSASSPIAGALAADSIVVTRPAPPPSIRRPTPVDAPVFDGRRGQTLATLPRVEGTAADIEVNGRLDEPVWAGATVLTGFSQYTPVDGQPAQDSTRVLVWYSATAIHFGIRAYEAHGEPGRPAVNATLADRDRIGSNDHVQLYLGTYDDGRQATMLAVNPLGIQADGTLLETGAVSGGFSGAVSSREEPDLRPDFVYQSKGRVTEWGWEAELRVPFKSLRYQAADVQRWGIQIVRRVQHSGYEDTWAPARRGASFLSQSGHLTGLTGLRRGLVVDLNPEVTQRVIGANPVAGSGAALGGWDYDRQAAQLGGNVRWGITNNLTLNGTVRPDFSQVEADAGQFAFDPRQAIFFPERRPFFLDGIEQFSVPNGLVYTRSIVQPAAAVKLAGNVSGTGIALLSAVDSRVSSRTGDDRPFFNILRLQRDLGKQSRVGFIYTDKSDGRDYNRVAGVDARIVFANVYTLQMQAVGSRTVRDGASASGEPAFATPLWDVRFQREGRRFGARYSISAVDPDFRTGSGFISRPGVTNVNVTHRGTWFGQRGARLESFTGEVALRGTWRYDDFLRQGDALEKKLHLNFNSQLRGGWRAGASVLVEHFDYDSALYSGYFVDRARRDGSGLRDTVPFVGTSTLPNLDYLVQLATPQWSRFSGDLFFLWGRDENFFEWAGSDVIISTVNAAWRPTGRIRVDGSYRLQSYNRPSDGSIVGVRRIPRLKAEYQIARPVFVRVVAQYDASRQADLRDESRTFDPLLIANRDGTLVPITGSRRRGLRADYLFSYQPVPGTVVFAGYGSSLTDPDPFGRQQLARSSDAFFAKLSYLFRL